MREIKFRAWDIKNKKMLTNIALYEGADHIGFSVQHAENIYGDAFKNGDIDFESGDGDWLYLLNGFHLMQSTGLKDKNGVEIYEGDIAKITWAEETYRGSAYGGALNYTELGVMQFDNGQFSFFVKDSLLDDDYKNLIVEVIGNIYENPELLENK